MIMSAQIPDEGCGVSAFLAAAEQECRNNGIRLTAIRQEVLRLIVTQNRPIGAYDILEALRATRRTAAPPTVYRALDFLIKRGFIHRLERLAAYVACSHVSNPHEVGTPRHKVQFLICVQCLDVKEICGGSVEHAIADIVATEDFTPHHTVVEIEGLCKHCV